MRGYVVIDKPELKVREYELYIAYYCGVCKSIGRRYGQLPRIALTYDAAFLALILSAINDDDEKLVQSRCIVHPIKKKNFVVDNEAIDYAADIMLMLSYGKLDDDIRDDGKVSAYVLKYFSKNTYNNLESRYPTVANAISKGLQELSRLEKSRSTSLDDTSDAFGKIVGIGMKSFCEADAYSSSVLYNLGYNLGRWIYLMDAAEDIEEDIEKNHYNPLLCRFEFDKDNEKPEAFRQRINGVLELNLFHYLGETSKALDLLELKKNEEILKNVIYLGLRNKTEEVIKAEKRNNDRKVL